MTDPAVARVAEECEDEVALLNDAAAQTILSIVKHG